MRAACIFIPHFPVAVELLARPDLRGRPLVIGGASEQRKTVLDCSPEAAAQGVRPGRPLRQALALCPKAAFLEPDPARYQDAFDAALRALEDISPLVEPADLGRAYVGVDGLLGLHQDEMTLGEALVQACLPDRQAVRLAGGHGGPAGSLLPSVGLGEGKFVAWSAAVVSAAGEVCVVPPGREAAFLAPLDMSLLPCSPHTLRRLELFGLRTIGDLAALALGAVQAQFGVEGRRLWELAHGLDRQPLRPRRHEESLSERLAFSEPTVSTEALLVGGRQLLGRLFRRSSLHHHAVRRMRIRATLSDRPASPAGRRVWERTITFREATADRDQMLYVLRCTLEAALPSRPVEEMEVTLSGLAGQTGKQASFFTEKRRRRTQLEEALRQLKARFGQPPVYHIVEVEPWSRIPERRLALIDYDP